MTLIEIDERLVINMDNVFKVELIKLDKVEKYFFRFHGSDEVHATSREFESPQEAKEWLNLQIMRAAGANEIIAL